jgi:hypothetical protein
MASITVPEGNTLQESNRRVYDVVGSTTQFAIPFPYFASGDIVVYEDAVVLTEITDYTISGVAVDGGFQSGTVTLNVAVTNTEVIVLRATPIQRLTDFIATGPFPMDQLNLALDMIYALEQQLRTSIDRALRLADSDSTVTAILPNVDDRLSKYLAFDSLGVPTAVASIDTSTSSITAFGESLIEAANAAAARVIMETTAATRVYGYRGPGVIAANDLVIPDGYNSFTLSGSTTIKGLPDSFEDGHKITFYVDAFITATIEFLGSPSAGYLPILIPGSANLVMTAFDSFEIELNSSDASPHWKINWYQKYDGKALVETSSTNTSVRDHYRGLIITRPSATTVDVDIDEIIVQTSAGVNMSVAVNETIDVANGVGANGVDLTGFAVDTWYYIYVIAKADGTVDCLMSTNSAGAPDVTFDADYIYLALVGAAHTEAATTNFYDFKQTDKRAYWLEDQTILTGSSATIVAWTGIVVTDFFPDTAKRVTCWLDDAEITGWSPEADGRGSELIAAGSSTATDTDFGGLTDSATDSIRTHECDYADTIYYWTDINDLDIKAVSWEY